MKKKETKESHIKDFGYIDLDHFNRTKYDTYMGLLKFGDTFATALGNLLSISDQKNAAKIMRYWFQECEQYAILYRMYIAKQKAEKNASG